jgi:hypothetical protein
MALTACASPSSTTTAETGPGFAPPDGTAAATTAGGGSGGQEGYEGRLITSDLYDATWTVSPEQPADVFNSSAGHVLTSDKGTFGNVMVQTDGSLSFSSAAPELSDHGLTYTGSGAQVTLDETEAFVCAFTVDTDLVAGDGTPLHISGGLTVHWHPEGLGGLNCP